MQMLNTNFTDLKEIIKFSRIVKLMKCQNTMKVKNRTRSASLSASILEFKCSLSNICYKV